MKRVILPLIILGIAMTAFADADLTSARIYRNQGEFIKANGFFTLSIEKDPTQYGAYFERGEMYGMIAMDRTKKGVMNEIVGEVATPQFEMIKLMLADFDVVRNLQDPNEIKKQKKNLKKIENAIDSYWTEFYNESVDADEKHALKLIEVDSLAAAGDTAHTVEGATEMTIYDQALATAESLHDKVIHATNICILLKPDEWNPYALKAQVLDRSGKIDEANIVWEMALESLNASDLKTENNDKYMEAWLIIQLHRLQNYYNFSRYPKAVEVANEIHELIPDNQDAVIFKAFALTNMVNDTSITEKEKADLQDQAVVALEAAREVTPDDSAIPFYLGQFAMAKGDTTKTIEWWTTYTEMDTTDYEVLFQIGYIYLEGGSFIDYAKSESIYQEIVTRHPEQCTGWINLGVAQIKQEKTKLGSDNVKKGEDCSKQSGE
jgi:tetratricopeptide (TPR) repeat protein